MQTMSPHGSLILKILRYLTNFIIFYGTQQCFDRMSILRPITTMATILDVSKNYLEVCICRFKYYQPLLACYSNGVIQRINLLLKSDAWIRGHGAQWHRPRRASQNLLYFLQCKPCSVRELTSIGSNGSSEYPSQVLETWALFKISLGGIAGTCPRNNEGVNCWIL